MTSYIHKVGNQLWLTLDGVRYIAQPTNVDVWILNDAEAGPGPGEPPTGTDQTFDWPFNPNTQVSSEYGPRNGRVHQGIDFGINGIVEGLAIHASAGGTIQNDPQTYHSGFGNHVIINHGNIGGRQLFTLYAHMLNPSSFHQGNDVNKGDVLGGVNNTGSSQGNHLHWETHIANPGGSPTWTNPGTHINPRSFMATYQNTTPPLDPQEDY